VSDGFNVDWASVPKGVTNGQQIALGGDAEFVATFYMGKVPNFEMTDYVEVPHIRLQAPGSSTVYDQPVRTESFPGRPSDPERFPAAWSAFQAGQNFDGTGTPLADWDEVSPGDVRRLEITGVRTVEQLAQVSDRHIDGLGFGGRVIRQKAQAFVQGVASVDPEKAQLKEQVGKLTDIVTSLLERLGEAPVEPAPPTSRKKVQANAE
jgi:hypothetical protein